MNHSDSMTKLAAALAAAQGEIEHATKNAANPHFRSTYADLAEIINTVRPVLSKHGLAVVQFPGYADGVTTVETILTHSSGEFMSGVAGARVQKDDPQGVGSAITYLRRYSLAAVCGIAQEDDDGNAAAAPTRQQQAVVERMYTNPAPRQQAAPAAVEATIDLAEPVSFGKHRGRAWADLVESEPGWVEWAIKNLGDDKLPPKHKQVLQGALELHKVPAGETYTPRPGVPLTESDDRLPFA